MIKGFDASSVQQIIPWERLDPELRFVILKGQQGNDGFDPLFVENVVGALAHGIEPFAYAFAYPLPHLDPVAQARLFVERTYAAHPAMRGRPLFLDYEWPDNVKWKRWGCSAPQINRWCRDNAAAVAMETGIEPVIYTDNWWWDTSVVAGGDCIWALENPLWIASYPGGGWPKEGAKPVIPHPWKDWLFWQFDGNQGLRLPNGVDCDFCVFNGDWSDLQTFAGNGAPETIDPAREA